MNEMHTHLPWSSPIGRYKITQTFLLIPYGYMGSPSYSPKDCTARYTHRSDHGATTTKNRGAPRLGVSPRFTGEKRVNLPDSHGLQTHTNTHTTHTDKLTQSHGHRSAKANKHTKSAQKDICLTRTYLWTDRQIRTRLHTHTNNQTCLIIEFQFEFDYTYVKLHNVKVCKCNCQ